MTNSGTNANTEYLRQLRAENPERVREYRRRYDEANAERLREYGRQYYRDNREREQERNRRWRAANPERERENRRRYYQANAERLRERARQRRLNGHKTARQRRAAELVAKLLQEQDGRCYLCGTTLTLDQAHLDHDHRCCPKTNTWCTYCIRGAACVPCNQGIGLMRDDPDLIERIARNLRVKLAEVDERMAAKPVRATL